MAAGLGFKDFVTGEVLTAADVDGYLMQGIWVFTNATARDAAVTSPQEGNFAFTKDNNSLWYYDGAAWVASGATGDIEGVTAGIGISGGGTSGTVTVTNSMATAIDAKGDLVAGTGADTFAKLTVGANGTILTADSAEATGLKWATPAGGGGKVLQVVQATLSGSTISTTSGTMSDTGLTVNITPSSASSKVLVLCYLPQNNTSGRGSFRLMRGATAIVSQWDTQTQYADVASFIYLDSPATTSATTYKVQFRANSGTQEFCPDGSLATINVLEIGA